MEKTKILNINFYPVNLSTLIKELEKKIQDSKKQFIVTANPEIVMYANKNEDYQKIVNNADYVIADGYGVVLGSKIIGNPLPERVPGFDIMKELLQKGNEQEWKVYFLGAKKEVIDLAIKNIHDKFPKLNIVGWHDGYFDWNSKEIQNEIVKKAPDLVFVALGFPKQEFWIHENIPNFKKGIFMGVGGSFDVWAGKVKRAPVIWQKTNLEWLYRLIQQPSRWKRMLALPMFVLKVTKGRFK
jgi:N-acetylglucosaminyldiphosphoundecaprenol N-acetyl-beta-D-mannosaminyltransferase